MTSKQKEGRGEEVDHEICRVFANSVILKQQLCCSFVRMMESEEGSKNWFNYVCHK